MENAYQAVFPYLGSRIEKREMYHETVLCCFADYDSLEPIAFKPTFKPICSCYYVGEPQFVLSES